MVLNPGDIGFVQYNAAGADNFAFVALVDIPAGEQILFTDNGWLADNSGFRSTEGVVTWTAPDGGVVAGTIITIDTTPAASVGTVTATSGMNLAIDGDQLIAYQNPSAITLIAALNNEGAAVFQTDATSSHTSALPQGLTVGQTAVALNEIDNAVYTGPTTGDRTTLLAALNNSSNWTGSDSPNQTFSGTFTIECFLAGTRILCDRGEIPVEELTIGDCVLTPTGNLEPIKWIGQQTIIPHQIKHPLRSHPIRVRAGALGHHLPHRDLYLSPDHALLVDGLLVNAGALVNDISILTTTPTDAFTYYHIELHRHTLLVAEGLAAESYLPQKNDRSWYDNGAEYEQLYPHNSILVYWPMQYPRISSKRQLPQSVNKRLKQWASQLPQKNASVECCLS